jgi:tetratricopeptide (TPR) repeat protein
MKEYVTNGICHKIVVYDSIALNKLREAAKIFSENKNNRTDVDWTMSLNKAYLEFKTPTEKVIFYKLLGCPIINIILHDGEKDLTKPISGMNKSCIEVDDILCLIERENSFYKENRRLLGISLDQNLKGCFYPCWKENDGGRLERAKYLYSKGKDIPIIIKLLVESIAINPIKSEKWGYLGGVLKVTGRYEDALIAYVQSLRFDETNKWSWKGLRDCCERCGFVENAKGLTWYLRMKGIE